MSTDARKPHTDRDGVRVFEKPGARRGIKRLALGAAVVLALGAASLLLLRRGPARPAADDVAFPAPLARPPVAARAVVARPVRKPPMAGGAPAAGPAPSATQVAEPVRGAEDAPPTEDERRKVEALARGVIDELRASGETSGLAAFPPPGTDPLKIGIVVPRTFALPEGYVRHYQITDDGQRLEPILMFSPDYEFRDDSGQLIEVPEDRIVPASLAPPGLPVRMLEPPGGSSGTAPGAP
jgi:hypothetical protein